MYGLNVQITPGTVRVVGFYDLEESERNMIGNKANALNCGMRIDGKDMEFFSDNGTLYSMICWLVDQMRRDVRLERKW